MQEYIHLREIIEFLETLNQDAIVPFGFGEPMSYRGYYSELAFEPKENAGIGDMLTHARNALGNTFTGYKGGDYTMTETTDCWIASWGCSGGDKIGPTLLQLWGYCAAVPQHDLTAPRVPEGWKLVPEYPTDEMLEAGYGNHYRLETQLGSQKAHIDYVHMIAAAPQPTQEG